MKLFAGFGLTAALCIIPAAARADPPGTPRSDYSARLEAGFGAWTSRQSDTTVSQYRFTLAPEFAWRDTLTVAPMLRMTTTSIDLRQKDGMPFDASLSLPWQPSLGLRLGVTALRFHWFRLGFRGEVEFPLGENDAYVSSFTPRGEIAGLPIDVDTLRNHVQVRHLWSSAMGAVTLGGQFGRFRPYVDLGYMYIQSRLSVNFDAEANGLLNDAHVNPQRFYDSGTSTFYYMLGTDVDLGRGFGLRLTTTLLPTGDRLFFAAEGSIFVPFDLGF